MGSAVDYLNKRIAQVSNTVKSHLWNGHGHGHTFGTDTKGATFTPTAGATSQPVPWEGPCDDPPQYEWASAGSQASAAAMQNQQSPYVTGGLGNWMAGASTLGNQSAGNYQGIYLTGTTTGATWTIVDPKVQELEKKVEQLMKRIEWMEAQPALRDNPPPIGLDKEGGP